MEKENVYIFHMYFQIAMFWKRNVDVYKYMCIPMEGKMVTK